MKLLGSGYVTFNNLFLIVLIGLAIVITKDAMPLLALHWLDRPSAVESELDGDEEDQSTIGFIQD